MEVSPPPRPGAGRSPERCPYHKPAPPAEPDGSPAAFCGFLEQLTGIGDPLRCQVGLDACRACCLEPEPAGERINSVIASFLFGLTVEVPPKESHPLWNSRRVDHLQELALAHMERVDAPRPAQPSRVPPYTGPCFFLGPESGRVECTSCRGRVLLKEFLCQHPYHERTTIRSCRSCQDYEAPLLRGRVRTWAVAVVTAPRRSPTLARTLESLARAGWKTPFLFAEPGSKLPRFVNRSRLTSRREVLGAWGNWLLAASELALLHPHADAYLICQDDAVFCRHLREYLETHLWPAERVGVVSLHTPRHHTGSSPGFFPFDPGWGAWGAMAYLFPNASLRNLLSDPRVINHRHRGPGDGLRNVDSVVGDWCRRSGVPYFLHSPSLSQHTGETSTLWKNSSLRGRRSAADFPGEDFDARRLPGVATSTANLTATPPAPPFPEANDHAGIALLIDATRGDCSKLLSSLPSLLRPPPEALLFVAQENSVVPAADAPWIRTIVGPGSPSQDVVQRFLTEITAEWIAVPDPERPLPPDAFDRAARMLQEAQPGHGILRTCPEHAGSPLPGLTIFRRDAAVELGLCRNASLLGDPLDAGRRLTELGWRDLAAPAPDPAPAALPLRDSWSNYRFTLVTVLIGRRQCFDSWLDWLRNESFPDDTSLVFVDNSSNEEFGALLRDSAMELIREREFAGLRLVRGPGPVLDGPRLSLARYSNYAHALHLALAPSGGDLALTIDCDVVPAPGAVQLLLEAYTGLVRSGAQPGAVSGVYESANYRGHLTAARSRRAWRDIPEIDEIAPGELVEVGFAGNGCCLMAVPALHQALPLRPRLLPGGGVAGPDYVLCETLRRFGYTVWLHGSVRCRHFY
ncbi:MAG TPA: hypothetical protein VMN36_14990 [Verrucomicrobiales bacterium]|nr:hypothetical protein [Verrucomicrobiales bacterium]